MPWSPGSARPAALAALGDKRLRATRRELEEALTGRFRDIHAFEIQAHLRLIDAINDEIALLDDRIAQQLALVPRTAPACTSCGLADGDHAPGCAGQGTPVLGLAERLDEITGVGECNARVIIAGLGTDPSIFPAPGHAAAWARLTSRSRQSGETARPGRTGKGNRYMHGALGQAAMTAARTDTRLGAQYRRIARKRQAEGHVAVSRVICEIAWILICDPGARYEEPGPDYYSPGSPARQTRHPAPTAAADGGGARSRSGTRWSRSGTARSAPTNGTQTRRGTATPAGTSPPEPGPLPPQPSPASVAVSQDQYASGAHSHQLAPVMMITLSQVSTTTALVSCGPRSGGTTMTPPGWPNALSAGLTSGTLNAAAPGVLL